MSEDWLTAQRVRDLLAGRGKVVETRMMGGLVFMLDGHLCCGVGPKGLLVRVGKEGREDALAAPHTAPMRVGTRSPAGFVRVQPEGFESYAELASWVERGIAVVRTLPPKAAGAKRRKRPA